MGEHKTVIDEADALARAGRGRDAVRLIERAALSGDAVAQHELAQWRLFGIYGPRDHRLTMELLSRARAAGHMPAAKLEAVLIGNGSLGNADPLQARRLMQQIAAEDAGAARQLELLDAMPPLDHVAELTKEPLSESPAIFIVRRLISAAEADYLIHVAQPALHASFVVDPTSGRQIPHPIRTSSGMNFGPADEDLVVHALNRRVAAASGTQAECGEMLNILRYTPGQEYRLHSDAVPGLLNQRQWTVLIYLNSGYEGGETVFPDLDLAVKGEVGDALIFRNTTPDGQPDVRTRHSGDPVRAGTKWLASRWVRMEPYSPWGA